MADNSIALELTTKQRALLVQEKHFAESVNGTKFRWSNMELANIELLHILDKHNCHNTAYQDIMG